MKNGSQEKGYNTHLASEYLVMSNIHRLGLSAFLTIGNMKSLDILVKGDNGKTASIEVKGVAKQDDYLVAQSLLPRKDLFFVLVCFNNKIQEVAISPKIWVVPSEEIVANRISKSTHYVRSKFVRDNWAPYENAWHLIADYVTN